MFCKLNTQSLNPLIVSLSLELDNYVRHCDAVVILAQPNCILGHSIALVSGDPCGKCDIVVSYSILLFDRLNSGGIPFRSLQ